MGKKKREKLTSGIYTILHHGVYETSYGPAVDLICFADADDGLFKEYIVENKRIIEFFNYPAFFEYRAGYLTIEVFQTGEYKGSPVLECKLVDVCGRLW